jgi:energy-coupling factor transporter ATP-binding protein EcfA2
MGLRVLHDKSSSIAILIENHEEVLRYKIQSSTSSDPDIVYGILITLKYVNKGVEDVKDENLEVKVIESIINRAMETEQKYFLMSCISADSVTSHLIILSEDKNLVLRESEILCSLITSLTNNLVMCKKEKPENAMAIMKRCFHGQSYHNPLSWLFTTFSKRIGVNEKRNMRLPHPLSFEWGYPNVDASKYDYLLSVFKEGGIKLGVIQSTRIIAKLRQEHIQKHVLIVGATGSGKSTTASIIAREVSREGAAVFIADWHGEYRELLKDLHNVTYTNPMEGIVPEFLNMKSIIEHEPLAFIEILESTLELTPPQAHILEEAMKELLHKKIINLYEIDVLIDIIQNTPLTARWIAESREALVRKLKVLSTDYLKVKWGDVRELHVRNGEIMIFDVSSIPNTRVKRVFVSIAIKTAALKAQHSEVARPLVIIVDEAHNVFTKDNPVSNLIAEVRKWGIGFIIVTQSPSSLAPVILKNTNTKIVHTLKSTIDVKTMLGLLVLKREYKKVISSLKPGEALIIIPELIEPVLVKIGII